VVMVAVTVGVMVAVAEAVVAGVTVDVAVAVTVAELAAARAPGVKVAVPTIVAVPRDATVAVELAAIVGVAALGGVAVAVGRTVAAAVAVAVAVCANAAGLTSCRLAAASTTHAALRVPRIPKFIAPSRCGGTRVKQTNGARKDNRIRTGSSSVSPARRWPCRDSGRLGLCN